MKVLLFFNDLFQKRGIESSMNYSIRDECKNKCNLNKIDIHKLENDELILTYLDIYFNDVEDIGGFVYLS